MIRTLLIAVLLLFMPAAATAQSLGDPPAVYVASVYDRLANGGDHDPPETLYTPRLLALWKDMKRDSGGEIGRIDFFYWTGSQDWALKDVTIGSAFVDGHEDRQMVTASFRNGGEPRRIRFYFEKTGGKWRLDDVVSEVGEIWTLSVLLKYGRPGGD